MAWSPDEATLEQLKAGWTVEGASASQLAARFGQTRNVVIGIAHRRGWQKAGGSVRPRPRLPSAPRPPAPGAPEPPAPEPPSALVLDPEKFVTMDQLDRCHCRYPVGDGKYCGALPNETPYCDGHARIVYQPRPERPRKHRR